MSAVTTGQGGMLGVFDGLDAAVEAIERLRAAKAGALTVFSPMPSHDLEHALHPAQSPVRMFTLVGGLTGTATGFALPTWTSMDWPLVTGGKPIISMPAWVISSMTCWRASFLLPLTSTSHSMCTSCCSRWAASTAPPPTIPRRGSSTSERSTGASSETSVAAILRAARTASGVSSSRRPISP